MHKERTTSVGLSEKFVFDEQDIAFIKGDGAMFNKQMLADHFGVSVGTIYEAMKRQPEMYEAYEDAKVQQKNMKKETIAGYQYRVEKIVFDAEDIKKVEKLAASHTLDQIAEYFGIGKTTFKDIRKRQIEVEVSYKKGKAREIEVFYDHLKKKAFGKTTKGDTGCLIFYLKTQGRWSEAAPETKIEEEITETPEEKAARMKEIKDYTEYLNEKADFIEWKNERAKK